MTEEMMMTKPIQITRYRVETNDLYDMEESPNGSWVSWDDVEPLIKAAQTAPDLYEALEYAVSSWSSEFEFSNVRIPEWVTEARAALAKVNA